MTFPGNKTVGYAYDPDSRRASITYPDGKAVEYSYDPDERLSGVTDWLSHVTQYAYDPAGNPLTTEYPNKAQIGYAYDAANRLTSVTNTTVGVPPLTFAYTLDPVGNRTVVKEAGIPTIYGYDALNQLTSAETWFLKTTWTYDADGNRLNQISPFGTTNYTYDDSDRLLNAGARTFNYDADGNEISETNAFTHSQRTFTFNAANRLVAVNGGPSASFVYDGDGNRVVQSEGSWTQNYVNDVAAALPVVLQDAYSVGAPSSYVYGLNLIEGFHADSNYFYQYDGVGSMVHLTNSTGVPDVSYFYDAWGNSLFPTSPNNPFRFAGQALDQDTGLYYLRARYYDPSTARFISMDPSAGISTIPSTLNRYRYAEGNPLRLVDPTGKFTIPIGPIKFIISFTQFSIQANQVYDANQELSQQCGYTGGDFGPNCYQAQLNSQTQEQKLNKPMLDTAESAPGLVYSPSVNDVPIPSSASNFFSAVSIAQNWDWLIQQAKSLFEIPVAHAAVSPAFSSGGPQPAEIPQS